MDGQIRRQIVHIYTYIYIWVKPYYCHIGETTIHKPAMTKRVPRLGFPSNDPSPAGCRLRMPVPAKIRVAACLGSLPRGYVCFQTFPKLEKSWGQHRDNNRDNEGYHGDIGDSKWHMEEQWVSQWFNGNRMGIQSEYHGHIMARNLLEITSATI